MVKVAVASTDGKVVNQHFGRAEQFYILETDEDTFEYQLIEVRKANPVCHSGDHEKNQMVEAVSKLSDCQIVLVSRIGMRAKYELERQGIDAFEIPGMIAESVNKLMKYRRIQALFN